MIRIKNCGLKTTEAIHAAASSGASFIGFVHHLPSPRHLEFDVIARLAEDVPSNIAKALVLVDPSDEMLEEALTHVRPEFLQLHKVRDPGRIRDVGSRTGIPVITGINVRDAEDVKAATDFEPHSAHLLFDTFHNASAGGTGQSFDWALLANASFTKPWFLAGGLNEGNIAEALAASKATMVDVSSGIEDMPGHKSLEKIAAFNRAVLHAAHA